MHHRSVPLPRSQAAAKKRKADAMSPEERTLKRQADQHRRRGEQATKKAKLDAAAAAAAAVQTFEQVAADAALLETWMEQVDFCDWLLRKDLLPNEESLGDWRASDCYERTKHERIVEACTCFNEPNGGKTIITLPWEELKRRVEVLRTASRASQVNLLLRGTIVPIPGS